MFDKSEFRKEATPRRVFAFLKLIEYKDRYYTKKEVTELIQPNSLNNDQIAIAKVLKLCLDEEFIKLNINDKLSLNIDKKHIINEVTFRKYVNSILFQNVEQSIFISISQEILSSSSDIYEISGFSNIAEHIKSLKVNEEVMLAWRFWASFLGYGFILGNQFVINPYLRIKDILDVYFNEYKNTQLKFGEFISKLINYCPDLKAAIDETEVNDKITIALETLKKLGVIDLIRIPDATENYLLKKDNTNSIVTHIKYIRGETNGN